jgi:hypothetical protein
MQMNTATKIVLGAVVLGAMIGMASVSSPDPGSSPQAAADIKAPDAAIAQAPELAPTSSSDPQKGYVAQLERETASLSKGFDLADFGDGSNAVQLAIGAFKLEARLYYDGNQYDLTPEQQRVRSRFERALMAAQKRTFPKLRMAWAEQSANKLWEHDIEVRALGPRSDIIAFTGGMFASNANSKEMYDQLRGILEDLRFRQSRFAWAHSVGYTYWDLRSSKDDALLAPVGNDLARATN